MPAPLTHNKQEKQNKPNSSATKQQIQQFFGFPRPSQELWNCFVCCWLAASLWARWCGVAFASFMPRLIHSINFHFIQINFIPQFAFFIQLSSTHKLLFPLALLFASPIPSIKLNCSISFHFINLISSISKAKSISSSNKLTVIILFISFHQNNSRILLIPFNEKKSKLFFC